MALDFDIVRTALFRGRLSQKQVDGINTIVAASDHLPKSYQAYLLATTYHETAYTMQPIKEHGGPSYFRRMYDMEGDRPVVAKRLGNVRPGDGIKYAGRGFVQITGRANYERAGRELNVDLVNKPDLALQPSVAARILVRGSVEGWFTGKKLGDYLPGSYVNARRVINHLDRAQEIAGYAVKFERALANAKPPLVASSDGWFSRLIAAFRRA